MIHNERYLAAKVPIYLLQSNLEHRPLVELICHICQAVQFVQPTLSHDRDPS